MSKIKPTERTREIRDQRQCSLQEAGLADMREQAREIIARHRIGAATNGEVADLLEWLVSRTRIM